MRYSWLNLLLRVSNKIFQKKQTLVKREGISAALVVLQLISLEMLLVVVSLPLYLSLRPDRVVAFFAEKESYAKVAFDYRLRRILTLTGVGIILVIWIIKLLLIIFVPLVFGPLQLYTVSEPRPPELTSIEEQVMEQEIGIQSANLVQNLLVPELEGVTKTVRENYIFEGVGEPSTSVVLLISDVHTAVYTADVDEDGAWEVEHSQELFELNEGNHLISAFTYNADSGTRSDFSSEQYFKVESTWIDRLVTNFDTLANWAIVAVVSVGVFLIFLTI